MLPETRKFVEISLGDAVLCSECGATLATYDVKCGAEPARACAGFLAIEEAVQRARERQAVSR